MERLIHLRLYEFCFLFGFLITIKIKVIIHRPFFNAFHTVVLNEYYLLVKPSNTTNYVLKLTWRMSYKFIGTHVSVFL